MRLSIKGYIQVNMMDQGIENLNTTSDDEMDEEIDSLRQNMGSSESPPEQEAHHTSPLETPRYIYMSCKQTPIVHRGSGHSHF